MSRRARLFAVFASTPLVILVTVGGLVGTARPATGQQGVEHLRVFWDVVRLTMGAYVEPPDMEKVLDGAMRGLADGLGDPLTAYLPPSEVAAFDAAAPAAPAGTGLTLTKQFYLRVVGVRDDSPAARAGLRAGDYIRAIDDVPTRDMSVHTGTGMLGGAAGSKVVLLVFRGNAAEPRTIEITRAAAAAPTATGRRLPGGEAYVRVVGMGPGIADRIRSSIATLGAAATGGVIIDLRDVADGAAEHGVAAARLFVASGTLATRATRHGAPEVTAAAPGDGALKMPVVLLVSNGTGHAAEVFASALADNKRATLVGLPTAGLAATQSLVKLPEGHGLLMTTAQYVRTDEDATPIHGRGLRPDVIVETPLVQFDETPPAEDAILARAVELLHKTP